MEMLSDIPWTKLSENLREQVERLDGPQGALVGAAYGVATTVAKMNAAKRKVTVATLLAAAAVGLAYGATEKPKI